jgi:N6-adenosine-specific RNA methylase IME4
MDGFGDTNFDVIDVIVDGEQSQSRAYRDNNPDTNKHYDECQRKASAAVPIAPQSNDDLRATHSRLTKIVECVRDAGFDLGTMMSVDEFVANGGAPEGALTSRWSQFAEQPEFLDNFHRCGLSYPPPPAKP